MVMDFPEPDSPTTARVSLLIQVKIHAAHSLYNTFVRLDVDGKILYF